MIASNNPIIVAVTLAIFVEQRYQIHQGMYHVIVHPAYLAVFSASHAYLLAIIPAIAAILAIVYIIAGKRCAASVRPEGCLGSTSVCGIEAVISPNTDPRYRLEQLCTALVNKLGCHAILISVKDTDSDDLSVFSITSHPDAGIAPLLKDMRKRTLNIPDELKPQLNSGDAVECSIKQLGLSAIAQVNCSHCLLLPIMSSDDTQGVFIVLGDRFKSSAWKRICWPSAQLTSLILKESRIAETNHNSLEKLTVVSRIVSMVGYEATQSEVHKAIVEAAKDALGTDKVALFAIDSCTGDIRCESTVSVHHRMRKTFLEHNQHLITNRDYRTTTLVRASDMDDTENSILSKDCGIVATVMSPIRSEAGASGALVAFYSDERSIPNEAATINELIANQAAIAISYTLAIEQLRYLLDDMAGANQELSVQATLDSLTGLPNHRSLQQTLSELCKPSTKQKQRVFSLVMVDVDHFKIYNDTHGHLEGDAVLRQVAQILSEQIDQLDMAARYGGEEFALILRGKNKAEARDIADRIRRSVSDHNYQRSPVTVSMGVAQFPDDANIPSEIIDKADRALYQAKVNGRNRVVVWGCASDDDIRATVWTCNASKCSVLLVNPLDDFAKRTANTLMDLSYDVDLVQTVGEASDKLRMRKYDIALISRSILPEQDVKNLVKFTAMHPSMPVVLIVESDIASADAREALNRGAADIIPRNYNPDLIKIVLERNIERRKIERRKSAQMTMDIARQSAEALAAALDAHNKCLANHCYRVASISLAIAEKMNLSHEERHSLELAAKIHDIGKLATSPMHLASQDDIFIDYNWQDPKDHIETGARIISTIGELSYIATIVRHHHERFDGTGTPEGLKESGIPHLSRILAVADAYDNLICKSDNKGYVTPQKAINEIKQQASTAYSPEVVDALESWLISTGELTSNIDPDRCNKRVA